MSILTRSHVPALLAAALATLVAALVLASPASAETWRYDDSTASTPRFGDLDTVRIQARERFVVIRVETNGRLPEELAFFFDTDGDRRPEFSASHGYSGPMTVSRNERWVGRSGTERCRPERVRTSTRTFEAAFSLRCLRLEGRLPRRLRFNVASNYESAGASYDHAPGERRWSRVVAVG